MTLDDGSSAGVRSDSIQRLVVVGYITAVVMPPVGFVVGIVLAARLGKPNSRRGLWVVVVSVIAALVWLLALATGVFNPNTSSPA
jgi:hypothetical protein